MEQASNIQQLNAAPTINPNNVPSISSSAVLVQLTISTWTARKLDKSATKKVAIDNNASVKAGNYNKNLLAGCTELEDLKKFVVAEWNYGTVMFKESFGTKFVVAFSKPKDQDDLVVNPGARVAVGLDLNANVKAINEVGK